jgi:hypothetical protein
MPGAAPKSGRFIGAVIVGVGVGFGVQLFITAVGQADVFVFAPDLHPVPIKGIKAQLNESAAQMHGHFPELALHANGGIQAHPPLGPGQEQGFPVGLRVSGAQVDDPLGKRTAEENSKRREQDFKPAVPRGL